MEEWMLNDLLECSVCLERLDSSSRVLPCQHTFCKKCLEEILTTHKELRCPECRVLVAAKIDELPPNVLLMRILEGMKNVPRIKQQGENQTAAPQQQSQQQQQQQQHIETTNNSNTNMASPPQHHAIHTDGRSPAEVGGTPKNMVSLHQPCAKALYDYESQEPGDLSFKKGDIIFLKKRVDANWYHGERNSVQGYFPATYVQVLTPMPSASVPQCVALYDFKMDEKDEKDCLTFAKGAVVTVIRRVDENWAEGRLSERIGIFPITFVEMNSSAKHLMKSSINSQPGPSRSAPALPVTNMHNSLNLAAHAPAVAAAAAVAAQTSAPSSPSSECSGGGSAGAQRVHSREKRLSLNANQQQQQQPLQQQQQQYHRRSAEIGRCARSGYSSGDGDQQQQQPGGCPTMIGAGGGAGSGGASSTFLTPPALYIALYPYKPQKGDELELRKGALYTVSEKCQDGWFKGTSVRTQKVGVFPGNYVQVVRSQPHGGGGGGGSVPCPASSAAPQPPQPTASCCPCAGAACSAHPAPPSGGNRCSGSAQYQQTPPPPPKLPPRALSPAATGGGGGAGAGGYKPMCSTTTSSSASIPAAVVARLATTPAPAPALSPRATINPPPNVVVGGTGVGGGAEAAVGGVAGGGGGGGGAAGAVAQPEKKEREKEKGTSLMKRLTSRKKSSPPLLHPFSIDNPVFEDGFVAQKPTLPPPVAPVHVRSGSCPSQLLQAVNAERCDREPSQVGGMHDKNRHPMGGSQRVRSNKHRPNILPGANLSIFTRSAISGSHVGHQQQHQLHQSPANGDSLASRDKDKRTKQNPATTTTFLTERFRCITPYPPNGEYELELRVGDVVYVHKKRDDGWYKGTLQRTGKTGLFPASFVESC